MDSNKEIIDLFSTSFVLIERVLRKHQVMYATDLLIKSEIMYQKLINSSKFSDEEKGTIKSVFTDGISHVRKVTNELSMSLFLQELDKIEDKIE